MSVFLHAHQRTAMRHAIQIDCQVVRERDFQLVGARTLDLSTDGMLVSSEVDVQTGEGLIVSFQATPFGIYFDTDATVARVIEGRRPGDRGRCVGIRLRLDAIARHILRGGLRKVPPPVPRRAQRLDYAETVKRISFSVH